MSTEEIQPTHVSRLAQTREHRWFLYERNARTDVVNSAQNAADQTGDPQFIVDGNTKICSEMVVSDTRRAVAIAPGRFRRLFAEEARLEALRLQAETPSSSDDAGGPA